MCLAAVLQDIVTLQNPFNFLERDSDVEGMSDGFDNGTAYGKICINLHITCRHALAGQFPGQSSIITHYPLASLYVCRVQ